jgi:hypothetical protein
MEFNYIKELTEGFGFKVFDDAENVISICVKGLLVIPGNN